MLPVFNPQQSNCLFLSPSRAFHDLFMPIPVSFIKQLLRRSAHRVHSVLCQVSFSSLRLHQLHQLKDPKSATHLSLCLISSSLAVIQFNPIFFMSFDSVSHLCICSSVTQLCGSLDRWISFPLLRFLVAYCSKTFNICYYMAGLC